MCSRFLESAGLALLLLVPAVGAWAAEPLRVCVDPDNLPYSRADGSGYEPRLARVLAEALQRPLELHWQPMRRGLVRKTLGAHECDVLMSVPVGLERVLTTRPYYRSSYVFVTRRGDAHPLASFDDPRLPALRIGVQLIGNDLAASPPGYALARHGAVDGVRGFTTDGGSEPGQGPVGERMVRALARGEVDALLAWGPQVGWFADHAAMQVQAASPPPDVQLPFAFGMAVAVRKGDEVLRDRLQQALDAQRDQVDAVLAEYGVPRVDAAGAAP